METMNNKIVYAYSIFSGTVYEILEDDVKYLDEGQLPLTQKPKDNCKKCYGRLNVGRDSQNLSFFPCSCLKKIVNVDIVRSLENFRR
jgi:hypothetical protein